MHIIGGQAEGTGSSTGRRTSWAAPRPVSDRDGQRRSGTPDPLMWAEPWAGERLGEEGSSGPPTQRLSVAQRMTSLSDGVVRVVSG